MTGFCHDNQWQKNETIKRTSWFHSRILYKLVEATRIAIYISSIKTLMLILHFVWENLQRMSKQTFRYNAKIDLNHLYIFFKIKDWTVPENIIPNRLEETWVHLKGLGIRDKSELVWNCLWTDSYFLNENQAYCIHLTLGNLIDDLHKSVYR